MSFRALMAIICISVLQAACALSSGARVENMATDFGFKSQTITGMGFSHAVFTNRAEPVDDGPLHVYLEGDGVPWQLRYFVSQDPTPRNPLMLKLMEMDEKPAVYVGRPCYNGFANEDACAPALWTFSRYSAKVVDAMSEVITNLKARYSAEKLHLYGHSGGGTLALLIAAKRNDVEAVVTLAGNIDIERWTELHGYTALYGSINPAKAEPLDLTIRQIHLVGAQDKKIPPKVVLDWIGSQTRAKYFVFDDFNHGCCWEQVWEQTLNYLEKPGTQIKSGTRFPGFGNLSRVFNAEQNAD